MLSEEGGWSTLRRGVKRALRGSSQRRRRRRRLDTGLTNLGMDLAVFSRCHRSARSSERNPDRHQGGT